MVLHLFLEEIRNWGRDNTKPFVKDVLNFFPWSVILLMVKQMLLKMFYLIVMSQSQLYPWVLEWEFTWVWEKRIGTMAWKYFLECLSLDTQNYWAKILIFVRMFRSHNAKQYMIKLTQPNISVNKDQLNSRQNRTNLTFFIVR